MSACLVHQKQNSSANSFLATGIAGATAHGLGTCSVLLTIKHPFRTKRSALKWNSNVEPSIAMPSGSLSCIQPMNVHPAINADEVKQANGIGVPSKYLDLPVASFGSIATVTLKRANRVKPQRT